MLHILSTPNFTRQAKLLADLAIAHRLPSMNIFRHYVTAGGLMSYGVETGPMWRRAASYVAKILRGAKPAELPVEQASNFELVLIFRQPRRWALRCRHRSCCAPTR